MGDLLTLSQYEASNSPVTNTMKTYIHILLSMIFMNLSFGGDAMIYFLAGEIDDPLDGETFVVPVSDPAQIAAVRDMLYDYKNGEEILNRVIGIEVTFGSDSINHDYNQSPPIPHQWHASEFLGFSYATFRKYKPSAINNLAIFSTDPPPADPFLIAAIDNGEVPLADFTIIAELPFPYTSANADGSKETWIGRIDDFSIPWVYHYDFGWMFVPDTQQDGSWIWMNSAQKWVWTNEDDFPYLYSPADSGWKWYYHDPTNDQDWFYDFTSESWSQNL